ncbi:hypothetical protein ABPG72_010377 [Tetrahymena utriculariae]
MNEKQTEFSKNKSFKSAVFEEKQPNSSIIQSKDGQSHQIQQFQKVQNQSDLQSFIIRGCNSHLENSSPFIVSEEKQEIHQKERGKFEQLIFNIKLKFYAMKLLNQTPSRMFQNLTSRQFKLIDDISCDQQLIVNRQKEKRKLYKSKLLNQNIRGSSILKKSFQKQNTQNQNIYQQLVDTQFFSQCLKQLDSIIKVLDPNSLIKIVWDIFILAITSLYFILIPIYMTFISFRSQSFYQKLIILLPIIVLIDFLFKFNTGFYDKGKMIVKRSQIIKRCLERYFVKNVFIVLCYSIYIYQLMNSLSFSRYLDLLLLSLIWKIKSYLYTLSKLEEISFFTKKQKNIITLIKLIFTLMMIAHILSCLWIFLADFLQQRNIQTWLKNQEVNVTAWHQIYINSYYFTVVTMVTVGYGDVIPISQEEKVVSILFMLFLCGIFGYSMNTVGSILQSLNEDQAQIRQNMSIINQFMNRTKVSKKTQNAVREYLEYYWSEQREKNHKQEEQIFEILPENLRQNLLMEGKGIVLKQTAIFRDNFSDAFKQKIIPLIKERHYIPEQMICTQGEQDDCDIYFIEKGSVNILLDNIQAYEGIYSNTKQVITLSAGQSFGEISFFTGQPRTACVKSREFTTVQIINRQELLNELHNFQKDYEQFCNIKDNIQIYSDFQLIDLRCLSCQSLNHQLLQCPYIHFLPNQAKLRAQFMSSPLQERVYQKRKQKEKLKSIQLVKQNSIFINRLIEYDTEIEYYYQTYLERESENEDQSKSDHDNSSTKQFIDDQNGNQFQFSQFNIKEEIQKKDSNIQSQQQATSQLSQKILFAEVKQKNMYSDISPTKLSEEVDLFGNQIHRTPSSQVNKGKSRHASYVNKDDDDSLNLQKSKLGSSSYKIESSLGENRKQLIEENFVKPKGKQYYDDPHQGESTDQNQYIQTQIPFVVSQKCIPAYKNSSLKLQKLQDPLSLALQKYQTMLNKIFQIFQDMAPNALHNQNDLQSPSIKKHFSKNKISNNISPSIELQKWNSINKKHEPISNLMYKNQSSMSNSKAIVSKRSIGRYIPEQESKQTSNVNQSNQLQTKDTNFYLDETNNVQYIQSNQDIQREFYEEFNFDVMKNFEYYFPLNNFEHQMKLMSLNVEQRRKRMLRAHIENMNILKKNKSLAVSCHKAKKNSINSSQNLYTLNRQQNNNDEKDDQSKYIFKAQRESSLFMGDSQKKYDSLSLHQGKKGPQFNLNNLSFNNQIEISQINQKSNRNHKESIVNQTNLELLNSKLNQKNNNIIFNKQDDSFLNKENDIFDGSITNQYQQINVKNILSGEVMKRIDSFNSDQNEINQEQINSQKNSLHQQQIKNIIKGLKQFSHDDKQKGSNSKKHVELEIESQTDYSQNRRNIHVNDILIGMEKKTKL